MSSECVSEEERDRLVQVSALDIYMPALDRSV